MFYFNHNWQCLEEYVGSTCDARYLWGLRYIDDLVMYRKNTTDYYTLQDPNWNVIALVNTSGAVQERYTYTSFGKLNIFDATFATRSTSTCNITRTFTGQVYDVETGLMLYRNRVYHPTLGRFLQRDPIGYHAGDANLMRYVRNRTARYVDSTGLQKAVAPNPPVLPPQFIPTPPHLPLPSSPLPGPNPFPSLLPSPMDTTKPVPLPECNPFGLPNFSFTTFPPTHIDRVDTDVNCLGHAFGQFCAIHPAEGSSLEDLTKELGYTCTRGINAKDCECHCGDKQNVMVYVYVRSAENWPEGVTQNDIDNVLRGHDPWTSNWNNFFNSNLYQTDKDGKIVRSCFDYHGLRGSGCGNGYTEQGCNTPKGSSLDRTKNPGQLTFPKEDGSLDYFAKGGQFWPACCCKND